MEEGNPPEDRHNPLFQQRFVEALRHWIRKEVPQVPDSEDLAQEALLHALVTAARHGTTAPEQVERIARSIARKLVAQRHRDSVRKPQLPLPDHAAGPEPRDEADAIVEQTREYLRDLRPSFEHHLGSAQRRLLAAYLDRGITTVEELADDLGTSRVHVHRMLAGIRKKILRWSD